MNRLCLSRIVGILVALWAGSTQYARAQNEYWGCFLATLDGARPVLILTSEIRTTALVEVMGSSATYTVDPLAPLYITLDSMVMSFIEEVPIPNAVHVTSNFPIQAVLALTRYAASEETQLLPLEALGTTYMALCYPSTAFAHSEFAIVATENNTDVRIVPSTKTRAGIDSGVPVTITLNRGQVYLIQADINPVVNLHEDLTGTEIVATHPIALFGGHEWVAIPDDARAINPLYEQITPVTVWDKKSYVVPFANRSGGDLVRITATHDSTIVAVGSQSAFRLDRGHTSSITLVSAEVIAANFPIGIAQFSHSYEYDGKPNQFGDPFMITVPPTTRPINHATFAVPGKYFPTNFINVVALNETVPVTLDGQPLSSVTTPFTLPEGAASFTLPISDGRHVLNSTGGFFATVYGDTSADGYGYQINSSASMSVPVDTIPCAFTIPGDCKTGLNIVLTDTMPLASGIKSVAVAQADNMNVTLPQIANCPASVSVKAIVANPRKSASLFLIATDCAGNTTRVMTSCPLTTDTVPPVGIFTGSCTPQAKMIIQDTGAIARGIAEIRIVDTQNVHLVIPNFNVCDKTVSINCPLIDPTLPSRFILRVTDCDSNVTVIADSCAAIQPETLYVSIDSARGLPGTDAGIPITLRTIPVGYQPTTITLTLNFDPEVAAFTGWDQAGTLTSGFTATVDKTQPIGRVLVRLAGSTPLSQTGVLVRAHFLLLTGAHVRTKLIQLDTGWKFLPQSARPPTVIAADTGAIVVDTLCGLNGVSGVAFQMNINPNPANDIIHVRVAMSNGESVHCLVTNLFGVTLENRTLSPNINGSRLADIVCSTWPAGIYFVRASSGGCSIVKEIILSR